jgi:Rho-binding antiterminator
MNKDYTPIACGLYSEYELLIMHREPLRLSYLGARNRSRIETLTPIDLRTRRKAEYLIARNPNGICRVLRLDRIRAFDRMQINPVPQ